MGRIILAECAALPFGPESVDAVTAIWLLHLIDGVRDMIAEAARVLRPGGVLITTVNKEVAHDVDSDIDAVLRPYRRGAASDDHEIVRAHGAAYGLHPIGQTRFVGHGQGRTPRSTAASLRRGHFRRAAHIARDDIEPLVQALEDLPDPEAKRGEPVYTVLALQKQA